MQVADYNPMQMAVMAISDMNKWVRGGAAGAKEDWLDTVNKTHLPGSPIVKIFCPRQVLYTKRSVLPVAFEICVALNSFMALLGSYEPKCDF